MKNILILLLLIFISCNKKNTILLKHGMFMKGDIVQRKKEGRWLIKRKDSSLYAYGSFYNNNLDGEWLYFNKDGEIVASEFFIDGKKNGKSYIYYKDYAIETINYVNDSINGYQTFINFIDGKIIISRKLIINNIIDNNSYTEMIINTEKKKNNILLVKGEEKLLNLEYTLCEKNLIFILTWSKLLHVIECPPYSMIKTSKNRIIFKQQI